MCPMYDCQCCSCPNSLCVCVCVCVACGCLEGFWDLHLQSSVRTIFPAVFPYQPGGWDTFYASSPYATSSSDVLVEHVVFNDTEDRASLLQLRLGMCLPSMSTHWHLAREQLVRWWLAFQMGTLHPELEIDAGSLKIAELAHRSEVPVDWAIIGLGRSGTSSLAAWLDTHPQLELFRDKTDSFNEGAFHYLFRRTNLEHLVRRDSLSQNPAKTGRRKRRILAGFKEPHLLQQERGRLILAEMQHVKLLVIVKTLRQMLDLLGVGKVTANDCAPNYSQWHQ